MSTLFFDHLIVREEIEVELSGYEISPEDRQELLEIIDQTLTNQILNVILNHLPRARHEEFVSQFMSAPHDPALLRFLQQHAHPRIGEEIKKHADKAKKDILTEIKKTVRRSR